MRGIIVTGHGNFATGISSSVRLIAGEQEYYEAVDFLSEDTPDMLKDNLCAAIEKLADCGEVIIFTDLIGGSPFKTAVELSFERGEKLTVLSGTSLGMLIDGVFSRDSKDSLETLIETTLDTGRKQVVQFQPVDGPEVSEDEGI